MTLNEVSSAAVLNNSRGSFEKICRTKGPKGAINFLRTMNSMLFAVFLLFLVIGMIIAMVIIATTASRLSVPMPQEMGEAPTERVIDKTEYVYGDQLTYIQRTTENLAKSTHIQIAEYCSFEAPKDLNQLYNEIFKDNNGLLIYIHEKESSGEIYFHIGEGLSDTFTSQVIAEMNSHVSNDMEYFTHNRAERVIEKLNIFLPSLFTDNSYSNVFNYLTATFWLIMGPLIGLLTSKVCCKVVGVPSKRSIREAMIMELKTMQQITE